MKLSRGRLSRIGATEKGRDSSTRWKLTDSLATTNVIGSKLDGTLTGGNTSAVAGVMANGKQGFRLDGSTQYVTVDFTRPNPATYHVVPNEISNLWTKYAGNPVIAAPTDFGCLIKQAVSGWYCFASDGTDVYRWSSTDLINWSNKTLMLSHTAGNFDNIIVNPQVFQRTSDGTWFMFYRGFYNSAYQMGMATSSDGVTWTKKNNSGVNDGKFTQFGGNFDLSCVLLVGSTYYAYVSGSTTHGTENVYTSTDDCVTWTAYVNNPIFPDNSVGTNGFYCPTVFPYNGQYYMIICRDFATTSDYSLYAHGMVLYKCPDPYFNVSNRVFLGYVALNDQTYDNRVVDQPSIPFTDVTKTVYGPEFGDTLWIMYGGWANTGNAVTQNLISTTWSTLASRPPVLEMNSLLYKVPKSLSFWVQFDRVTTGDVVLSIADTPTSAETIMIELKNPTYLSLYLYGRGAHHYSVWTPSLNTPYLLTLTDDGAGNVILYKNTTALLTFTGLAAFPITYTSKLYFGVGYSTGKLGGYIGDVRMFQRCLAPAEVKTLYDGGIV